MPNNKTRNEKKKKHEIHNNTERKNIKSNNNGLSGISDQQLNKNNIQTNNSDEKFNRNQDEIETVPNDQTKNDHVNQVPTETIEKVSDDKNNREKFDEKVSNNEEQTEKKETVNDNYTNSGKIDQEPKETQINHTTNLDMDNEKVLTIMNKELTATKDTVSEDKFNSDHLNQVPIETINNDKTITDIADEKQPKKMNQEQIETIHEDNTNKMAQESKSEILAKSGVQIENENKFNFKTREFSNEIDENKDEKNTRNFFNSTDNQILDDNYYDLNKNYEKISNVFEKNFEKAIQRNKIYFDNMEKYSMVQYDRLNAFLNAFDNKFYSICDFIKKIKCEDDTSLIMKKMIENLDTMINEFKNFDKFEKQKNEFMDEIKSLSNDKTLLNQKLNESESKLFNTSQEIHFLTWNLGLKENELKNLNCENLKKNIELNEINQKLNEKYEVMCKEYENQLNEKKMYIENKENTYEAKIKDLESENLALKQKLSESYSQFENLSLQLKTNESKIQTDKFFDSKFVQLDEKCNDINTLINGRLTEFDRTIKDYFSLTLTLVEKDANEHKTSMDNLHKRLINLEESQTKPFTDGSIFLNLKKGIQIKMKDCVLAEYIKQTKILNDHSPDTLVKILLDLVSKEKFDSIVSDEIFKIINQIFKYLDKESLDLVESILKSIPYFDLASKYETMYLLIRTNEDYKTKMFKLFLFNLEYLISSTNDSELNNDYFKTNPDLYLKLTQILDATNVGILTSYKKIGLDLISSLKRSLYNENSILRESRFKN